MAKDYITVGKASSSSTYNANDPVMIVEDNPLFEKVKKYSNYFGLIAYTVVYNARSGELIFNLAPKGSNGLKSAMPSKRGDGSTVQYRLGYSVSKSSPLYKDFAKKVRVPTNNCYFEDNDLHVPVKSKRKIQLKLEPDESNDKRTTDAVAKELAKRLALQAGDLIPKLEDSIITTINSDAFISKLASEIMLKQTPQLTTKLNRIQAQILASNKQLKDELSKEFASAVKQLIDYWNK